MTDNLRGSLWMILAMLGFGVEDAFFKAATGSTLIQYLQNLRIEAAKHLLESGQMPVDDICTEAGYEDASFFRRLFKRTTGLTPSQYRRMFQPVVAPNLDAQ